MTHDKPAVLDLFSGIGGFSLGLERAGFRTVAFCEVDPFCRTVLAQHWPEVPCYDDVRSLTAGRLAADGIGRIDLICGGFPCQDLSFAGKGAGLAGERSGLWFQYHRLIAEIRPAWVVIENVSALRSRGLEVVLGGLAALGYDAEWHCIPAAAVGAPHRRDRIWILAYPHRNGESALPVDAESPGRAAADAVADADGRAPERHGVAGNLAGPAGADPAAGAERERLRDAAGHRGAPLADRLRAGLERHAGHGEDRWGPESDRSVAACGVRAGTDTAGWWASEPNVGRVAHGVPARVDRLRSLGNAVVPQIPEVIGRAIMDVVKNEGPTRFPE